MPQLRVPKLRQGSYFPPFLEARKTPEKALVAVIQEAWVGGASTRRVDDGSVKTWGRLLAHLWLVGAGSVVFASLRLAFACSGTVRHVTPAPVIRHQPAPGF